MSKHIHKLFFLFIFTTISVSESVTFIENVISGREIKQLVNTVQQAGYKSITWDATNNLNQQVSSGMYIYTIHAGAFVKSKKVILSK